MHVEVVRAVFLRKHIHVRQEDQLWLFSHAHFSFFSLRVLGGRLFSMRL